MVGKYDKKFINLTGKSLNVTPGTIRERHGQIIEMYDGKMVSEYYSATAEDPRFNRRADSKTITRLIDQGFITLTPAPPPKIKKRRRAAPVAKTPSPGSQSEHGLLSPESWGTLDSYANGGTTKSSLDMDRVIPHPKMVEILKQAYDPCPHFGTCPEAKWLPQEGHVPRGYSGCIGDPAEVEAVFVLAEPGHPFDDEQYMASAPDEFIEEVTATTAERASLGATKFHENLNWIKEQLWPNADPSEIRRKLWVTESRLCSVDDEIGDPKGGDKSLCAREYLLPQIEILPNAAVVLFGGKAQRRIGRLLPDALRVFALAPPGCNQKKARPSWEVAIKVILERRRS
jgi:hypothetical protein